MKLANAFSQMLISKTDSGKTIFRRCEDKQMLK